MRAAARPARNAGTHCRRTQTAAPHHSTTHLPELVVDIVHRITTDPARLSKRWLSGINAAGVTSEQYVELLGVVVAAISIDAFDRALGLPLAPLPVPSAGEPSGYRPPGAADSGAWVDTVQPKNAGPDEADLYPGGLTGNVISAMSLVPDSVRMLLRLGNAQYLPLRSILTPNDHGGRAISRCQIELLAGARIGVERLFLLNQRPCVDAPCERPDQRGGRKLAGHRRR